MPRYLALDLDHGRARLLAGSSKSGTVTPEAAIVWDESEPLTEKNATEVGKRLRDHLKDHKISAAPLWVSLGRDRVVLKEITFPAVNQKEEPGLVRFQTVKDLTEPAEKVVIDYSVLSEEGGKRRALAVIVRKEIMAAVGKLAESAGLKLAGVVPRSFGTVAALQQEGAAAAALDFEEGGCTAVLTHGPDWAELTITCGEKVLYARPLSKSALGSEAAMLGEVKRNLTVFAASHPGKSVGGLLVPESGLGSWAGRLRAGLNIPVAGYDPLPGLETETATGERGPFASLLGTLTFGETRPPVNLAHPREPVKETDPNMMPVMIAASVFGLIAVAGLAWGFYQKSAKDSQIEELTSANNKLSSDLQALDMERKRIEALEDWERGNIVWLDELYDLAHRFPDLDKSRLEEFSAQAVVVDSKPRRPGAPGVNGALGGDKKPEYAAKVDLKVTAKDNRLVDKLIDAFAEEGFYEVLPKVAKGEGYLVSAQIVPRGPGEYSRELAAAKPAEGEKEGDKEGAEKKEDSPLIPEAGEGGEFPAEGAPQPGGTRPGGFQPGGFQPGGGRPGGFQPGGFQPGGGRPGGFGGPAAPGAAPGATPGTTGGLRRRRN